MGVDFYGSRIRVNENRRRCDVTVRRPLPGRKVRTRTRTSGVVVIPTSTVSIGVCPLKGRADGVGDHHRGHRHGSHHTLNPFRKDKRDMDSDVRLR